MSQLQIPPKAPDQSDDIYKDTVLRPELRNWIERLKSVPENNIFECIRLIRELSPNSLPRLFGELHWLKHQDAAFPRYPKKDLLQALRQCAQKNNGTVPVGVTKQTPLDYYIDVGKVASNEKTVAILACALCHRIRKELEELNLRPTTIAIPRTCSIEFGRRVAQLLDYPAVYVDPKSPNGQVTIEGPLSRGNEVILIHDVVVSGDYPVHCAVELRKHGVLCKHLFALVHRRHEERDPYKLLSLNGLTFHPVETIGPGWFRFLDK